MSKRFQGFRQVTRSDQGVGSGGMTTMAESGAPQAGIDDIVGGMRGMMADSQAAGAADMQPTPAEILERCRRPPPPRKRPGPRARCAPDAQRLPWG